MLSVVSFKYRALATPSLGQPLLDSTPTHTDITVFTHPPPPPDRTDLNVQGPNPWDRPHCTWSPTPHPPPQRTDLTVHGPPPPILPQRTDLTVHGPPPPILPQRTDLTVHGPPPPILPQRTDLTVHGPPPPILPQRTDLTVHGPVSVTRGRYASNWKAFLFTLLSPVLTSLYGDCALSHAFPVLSEPFPLDPHPDGRLRHRDGSLLLLELT